MLNEAVIRRAVEALLDAAPGARVILFGSYGRGTPRAGSDLDFLVIEPVVGDRFSEMVRLRKVLSFVPASVDVLVASADRFEYWKDTPNTIYHQAFKEGRSFGQVA